jgi:hypothetical protein
VKKVSLTFEGMDAKDGGLELETIENMMADLVKT